MQTVIRNDIVEQIPTVMMQDILDYHSDVTDAAQTADRRPQTAPELSGLP